MRIERIDIRGFGCLVDRHYEFAEGKATLVVEDNEHGKSTLAAAIMAGLCGFPARKASGETMKPLEVYTPWESESYAVEMRIVADGKRLIVERDFARGRFAVRDADTNRDLTATHEQDLAEQFLHLPRDDFRRVAFVAGKEAPSFDDPGKSIQSRLSALAEGLSQDSGAEIAIAALENTGCVYEDRQIKVETALTRARAAIAEKTSKMAALDAKIDSLDDDLRELSEAQSEHERLDVRLRELDAEYIVARLGESRGRLDAAQSTLNEIAELEREQEALRRFAAAGESDLNLLRAASGSLEAGERAAASAEEKWAAAKGGTVYRALAGAGIAAGIAFLGLMIAGILKPWVSAIGVVVSILVAGLGLSQGRNRGYVRAGLETAQSLLDEAQETARLRLSALGIDCPRDQDLGTALTDAAAKCDRYAVISTGLDALERTRLSQEQIDGLKREVGDLESQGALPDTSRASAEVESERMLARKQKDDAAARVRELDRRAGTTVDNYRREYPVLRDEVAELNRHLAGFTRFGNALQTAARTLCEVAAKTHRRWAVALNEQASAILPRLNPDYDTLLFDDSLGFTIRSVVANRIIEKTEIDARLSTGAKDQIYLAVRLACCLELSRLGEPMPIILDDPFISADDDRFQAGFRYVAEDLAKRQQVIVLSCHKGRHDQLGSEPWFRESVTTIDLQS